MISGKQGRGVIIPLLVHSSLNLILPSSHHSTAQSSTSLLLLFVFFLLIWACYLRVLTLLLDSLSLDPSTGLLVLDSILGL